MVGSPKLALVARQADITPVRLNGDGNPVGPGDLLDAYATATDEFIRGQLYAETVMMQEPLRFSGIDKALETQIIEFQDRMRKQATYFYGQIVTGNYGYLAAIAGGYHLCALVTVTIDVTAGEIELAASNDKARQSAASAYSMLSDQAYDQSVAVSTLATKTSALDRSLSQYVTAYRDALKAVEADLTAAAKATLDEIDALRNAINQNLSDIVAGGEEAGGAVTNLIVGILTEIAKGTAGGADKPKKADEDKEGKEKGKPAAREKTKILQASEKPTQGKETLPQDKAGVKEDSFSVLAIKAVASGVAKLSAAEKELNANNDKLADAYQRLAQDQTMVAVAKAIEVQNDLFAAMVPLAAAAALDVNTAFQSTEAGFTGFSASVTSVTTDVAAASLAKQARRAKPEWVALNSELQEMKKTIIT